MSFFSGTPPPSSTPATNLDGEQQFYEEIWFIALMAVLGVLLLLALLACCIRYCGSAHPYIREQLPLQSRQHKQPFTFALDPNTGSLVAMVS